jgi:superfamily II DNA or RNA helicase
MVLGPSIRDLIDQGYLVQPLVYGPPSVMARGVERDLESVHVRGGDYAAAELAGILDRPHITGSAIDHYKRICNGVPAIAFCASIQHAQHVSDEFGREGIASAVLSGDLPESIRRYRSGALASGALRVIATCDLISEGYDVPSCGCVICLRPTKSTGLALQQWGRALRPNPGKTSAIILDHVGNCHRHGLPDDHREWSLDGSTAKKGGGSGSSPVRQCGQCYAVFSAGRMQCPQCGWIVVSAAPREIEQVEGTLELIRAEQMHSRQKRNEEWQADSLDDLLAIAERRGYNRQWAYIRWRLKRERRHRAEIAQGARQLRMAV